MEAIQWLKNEARKKLFALVLLNFLFCSTTHAQTVTSKGTEFWACFMENLDLMFNGPPYFYFTVASDQNANGTISLPLTGFSVNFAVTAGQLSKVYLPSAIYYPAGSEVHANFGFQITADKPVSVVAHHHRAFFSEATNVLPVTELGSSYMIIARKCDYNLGSSEFSVVGTEDNSVIEITPSVLTLGARPAGITFSVNLNKGQIYQVQAMGDLTGTTIKESTGKKIAIFSGSKRAHVLPASGCAGADDHLYEQNYPVSRWGTEYISTPFLGFGANLVRVLASENGSVVQLNCTTTKTLQAGNYFDTLCNTPLYIRSSKPVSTSQFITNCSGTNADPNFLIHQPLSLYAKKVIFDAFSDYDTNFVNVTARSIDTSFIYLDSQKMSFMTLPGYPGYAYAQVPLHTGTHIIQSDSTFQAFAYGVSFHDAYAYSTGYDGSGNTLGSLNIQSPGSLCKDSLISFSASTALQPSSWSWQFGDGSSSSQSNPSLTVNTSGPFSATLIVSDISGCTYQSSTLLQINTCSTNTVTETTVDVTIPNVFTPNADGTNDAWSPIFKGNDNLVSNYELSIYNRWGLLIFETSKLHRAWDGYTTSGGKCADGVYFYTLKYTVTENNESKPQQLKGFITLAQ